MVDVDHQWFYEFPQLRSIGVECNIVGPLTNQEQPRSMQSEQPASNSCWKMKKRPESEIVN